MRKRYIIIFILLFFSQNSFSQEEGLLTGTVVFDNNVVPFANVIISQDGEVITGTCTDSYGRYKISLLEGIYSVEVSSIESASEKIKIEIKADETNTLDFQLVEKRYDIVTVYDTIKVNAFEVKEIDEKLKVAIDNHIKMSKRKFIFPNKKRNIIVVGLCDRHYDYYDLEHIDINDVKLKHKQFKESQFGVGYNVYINFLRRNNRSKIIGLSNSKKRFYYKYNDWDIFLETKIDDLEFPFVDGMKNFEFQVKYKDIVYSITGKHKDNFNKTTKFYVKKSSNKRYESYYTSYYISEREVESVKTKRKSIFKDY